MRWAGSQQSKVGHKRGVGQRCGQAPPTALCPTRVRPHAPPILPPAFPQLATLARLPHTHTETLPSPPSLPPSFISPLPPCSKFVSGVLGSRTSPAMLLAGGLMATAALNVAFGFSTSLVWFCTWWAMNGMLQVGWVGLELCWVEVCVALWSGCASICVEGHSCVWACSWV